MIKRTTLCHDNEVSRNGRHIRKVPSLTARCKTLADANGFEDSFAKAIRRVGAVGPVEVVDPIVVDDSRIRADEGKAADDVMRDLVHPQFLLDKVLASAHKCFELHRDDDYFPRKPSAWLRWFPRFLDETFRYSAAYSRRVAYASPVLFLVVGASPHPESPEEWPLRSSTLLRLMIDEFKHEAN